MSLRGAAYRLFLETRPSSTMRLPAAIRELNASQFWTPDRLRALQEVKLRALVAHAYAHVPAYRTLMTANGVTPDDVRSLDDLSRLPIVTKADLRGNLHGFMADDVDLENAEISRTGGTTGMPMTVRRDRAGSVWQRACYFRGFSWGGLDLGEPWAQLFGGSLGEAPTTLPERLKVKLSGKTFLPAFELGPTTVAAFADQICRNGARHLVGYASAIGLMAELCEQHRIDLRFDAVFPTAELLLDRWREAAIRVFGARVLPYYGCGEVNSLAYTCPVSGDYHTSDEHAIIEVERGDGTTALTGEGAFLITDLDNVAMPFVRYRHGDAGTLADAGCACGRGLRRVTALAGRVNDVLLTVRGDRLSGVIGTHMMRYADGIEAFQIVQRAPGHALVRIVRGQVYDPAAEEPRIYRILDEHLGPGASVEIEYVQSIARTAAGKSRFVINEYLSTPPTP